MRAVRALAGRPARERHGRFLVEGPQAVRELVRFRPDLVCDLYASTPAAERHPEIVRAAAEAGLQARLGTAGVLAVMSADSQGVLAVARFAAGAWARELSGRPALVAVALNVRDPGNAGTIIRVADAAGADAVILAGDSVDVHNPKVVRATVGSLFHLPVLTGAEPTSAVAALRAAGLAVVAADGAGPFDLDELLDRADGFRPADARGSQVPAAPGSQFPAGSAGPDLAGPTAWLFGNEAWGLRPEDLALADAVVRVPIHGKAESLNLAAAAAVCLYASSRAQRTKARREGYGAGPAARGARAGEAEREPTRPR